MKLAVIDWAGLATDPWLWGLLGAGCIAFALAGFITIPPRRKRDRDDPPRPARPTQP